MTPKAASANAPPATTTAGGDGEAVVALEVLVELLGNVDAEDAIGGTHNFHDQICETVCRLSTVRRAVLFLYDHSARQVRAAGAHGFRDAITVRALTGSLDDTPIAERALRDDAVQEAGGDLSREIPERYVAMLETQALCCTPVSAAGQWLGVIFADRGGEAFHLDAGERQSLWMLGKLAALASSARAATFQQERARRLKERVELGRDLHDQVVQRLFGLSLALRSSEVLSGDVLERCRTEADGALGDLRAALRRPLTTDPDVPSTTLRSELDRRAASDRRINVRWGMSGELPRRLEPLMQSVLGEALRNVDRHARASWIDIDVDQAEEAMTLQIVNDGAPRRRRRGPATGLRLEAMESLSHGGVLEVGPGGGTRWRVRLIVPVEPG